MIRTISMGPAPLMRRVPQALATALVVAVSVLVLPGCSADAQLDETRWGLVGWTASSLDPAGFAITAVFSDGQVSGRSGVNSYSGSYAAGPGDAFEARELAGTLMAGPEEAMRAESIYLTLLEEARSFEVIDERLTLYSGQGSASLVFEALDE
jgi:heat shock protein HslJ